MDRAAGDQSRAAVMQIPGVTAVDVQLSARVREAVSADGTRQSIPGVKDTYTLITFNAFTSGRA